MKNPFPNIHLEKEVAVLSLFISTSILHLLFNGYDFSLTNYANITISQATVDGISISKRVVLFYKALVCFSFLIPLSYLLVYRFKNTLQVQAKELQSLSIIATTGFFLIISSLLGIESKKGILFMLFLFSLTTLFLILKKTKKGLRLLANNTYYGGVLTISFILLTTIFFLFNANQFILNNGIAFFFLITILLVIGTLFFKKYTTLSMNSIFLYLLPLSIIPIYLFISVELLFFFSIKHNTFISYKWIFVGLIFCSFLIFIVYNFLRSIQLSTYKLFAIFFIPSALLSFLLLINYKPIIEQPQELFELANPAIAQMRIFSFNQIPFIDFMSSHLFSEQFYGIFHNLVHGYDGNFDFLTYKFLYLILFYFIAYYFTLKLLKTPVLVLLFLTTFPFIFYFFNVHLFFSILVFFAIRKTVIKQTVKNYLLTFFLILFMCFWRLDVGASTFMTSIIFLPLCFFIQKKKVIIESLLKSLGVIVLITTAFFVIVSLLKETNYLLTNITSALHYISANQAHGYSLISEQFNQQFFVYHFIFPLISVLMIIYATYLLRTRSAQNSTHTTFTLSAALFLFLIYLANFQRGLVRHSFMENQDSFLVSTFFLATALFLLSFMKDKQPTWRYIYFFSLSFSLIILFKYFPIQQRVSDFDQFLTEPTISHLDTKITHPNFKGKVIENKVFAEQNYLMLKQFLDKHLSEKQSFLDFSNTPMLYYYCQRNVPSYFCQNLQNTVDDYLQLNQLKKINPETTPVVVYSNYPPTWWDNTDGVPNVMRQYLIAEYIYENYKPYGVINNHSVWIEKKLNYNTSNIQKDTLVELPQTYNYKYAALLINKYFESKTEKELIPLKEGGELLKIENNYSFMKIDSDISSLPSVFIKIALKHSINEEVIKVELYGEDDLIGTTIFTTKENELAYMVPISNHYLWFKEKPKYLRILNNKNYEIKNITFYKDIRDEY